jgi:N-acetylneuraminate lyase
MFDGEQLVNDASLSGIYPAIVTPLTADGELATAVVERLLARLMAAGVNGVYAAGSTGEGMRMSLAGREALVDCLMSNLPQGKKLLVHVGTPRVEDAWQSTRSRQARMRSAVSQRGEHFLKCVTITNVWPNIRRYR